MATAIIDRFEGDYAILEVEGAPRRILRSQLPPGAREGDAIDLEASQVDEEQTRQMKERVAAARARAKKNPFSGGKL